MAGERILVVDDDPALTEALTAVFESVGYVVDTASRPEEAVRRAAEETPDLIVLDVMLVCGTEGFHLAYAFRADQRLKDVPIIMLTAIHQRAPFRFSAESDGDYLPVDRFLEKPVDPALLLNEVSAVLGKMQAR